jgi:hypothetical protein
MAHTLWRFLPALRSSGDLKTLAEASTSFGEFQEFIETHYRGRRHLR